MNLDFECDEGGSSGGGNATIQVKKIIDEDGNLQTTDDQTPGVGWEFDIAGNAQTTDSVGETASVAVSIGTHIVSEVLQSGFTIVDTACLGGDVNGSFGSNSVTGIEITSVTQNVVCIFYNRPNDQGGQGGSSGGGGGPAPVPTNNEVAPPPIVLIPIPANEGIVLGTTTGPKGAAKGAVISLPRSGVSITWLLLSSLFLIGVIFLPIRKFRR
jgi:hypothetical protein